MSHQHRYRLLEDIVLTLPDCAGEYDRCLTWLCPLPCGEYAVVQGTFHVASPPATLAGVLAKRQEERRAGTAAARVAAREQRTGTPLVQVARRQQRRSRG